MSAACAQSAFHSILCVSLWCCAVDLVAARIKILISKLLKLKIVEIVGLLVSLIRSLVRALQYDTHMGCGVDRLGRFRVVNISTVGVPSFRLSFALYSLLLYKLPAV